MSCEKLSISSGGKVGRFPSFKVRTEDFSTGKCFLPAVQRSCRCMTCCARESVVLQDRCKCTGVCGKQVCGSFKPVCQRKPCSIQTSCHDHGVNTVIQDECRGPCGNKVAVSFPVTKWRSVCCLPHCDQHNC